jgi:hypothetical protein
MVGRMIEIAFTIAFVVMVAITASLIHHRQACAAATITCEVK